MNELCHLWRSERYGACGDDVSDGVRFTGEKYPKAAGDTGAEGPVRAKRPRFPGPLSEMRLAAVGFKQPPYLKAVACRFGALRTVTASPEQRYPPRFDSSCNSMTFLNAAPSLCAVV